MKKILLIFFCIFPAFLNAQTASSSCTVGLNNGFEIPIIKANSYSFINASNVPNWSTTAPDNIIEIWATGYLGVPSFEGNQFAELNANYESTLIKSFVAQAGVGQILKFAHRGRQGVDVMRVEVGPKGGPYINFGTFSDGNTKWQNYSISYTPNINGAFELRFISVSSAGGDPTIGNFLDGVDPGSLPIVSNIASPSIIKCNNISLDGSASSTGSNIVYSWTTFNGNIVSASNSNTVTISTSGTYTLTVKDTVLICSNSSSVTVNSAPPTAPGFTALATICSGGTAPALPATSTNGISGTWSPATVSNTSSGTYTFTPGAGQCATSATLSQTVNPNIVPGFTSLQPICNGSVVPALPTTSTNGISGSWSPATVSNTTSSTYTFTPGAGQCATAATLTQTVNPNIAPDFTALADICNGGTAPALPASSTNGISGTWSPATVSNTSSGTYTFTPGAGQCATAATLTQTVSPNITPDFTALADICNGGTAPALPASSSNGISGTWLPATVSNTSSGMYTFTPGAGQCATTATLTQTVNPNITPDFTALQPIFNGDTAPILNTTSNNGISGTWSPATVSNAVSGTYTFTPGAGQCASTATLTQTVNPNITTGFTTLATASINNIPNSFTPNGDGLNDIFHVIYSEMKVRDYFNILNRWGQLVFSTTELFKGWDGTSNGVKQPIGNYIWILKGKSEDNKDIFLKGSVLLFR